MWEELGESNELLFESSGMRRKRDKGQETRDLWRVKALILCSHFIQKVNKMRKQFDIFFSINY